MRISSGIRSLVLAAAMVAVGCAAPTVWETGESVLQEGFHPWALHSASEYENEVERLSGRSEFVLSAQCHAIAFYEKSGFVAEGPVYEEAGIDHRRMHWSGRRR